MTTDERISKDLAVVAQMSRARPISVDSTLRKVGALQKPIERSTAAPSLALLTLSRLYVARVARVASGAATFAVMVALLVYTSVPRASMADFGDGLWSELFYASELWIAALVVLVALSIHLAAARLATRQFERVAGSADDATASARRMVQRVDGWAIAAGIAGATSYLLFFGLMLVTLGRWGLVSMFEPHDDPTVSTARAASLALCAGAIAVSTIGAWRVGRARRGNPRLCIGAGVVIGLATVIAGMRFDVGPLRVTMLANAVPSIPLRAALTVTGTVALFLVVMGVVLRTRAREQAELDR